MSKWKKKSIKPKTPLSVVQSSITTNKLNINIFYKNYDRFLMYINLLDLQENYTLYIVLKSTKIYKSKKKVNMVIKSGNYSTCDALSGSYTEHLRLNARYRSYKSPVYCWYNNENFHKILTENDAILRKLETPTPEFEKDDVKYIYNSLIQYTRVCAVFKPTWTVVVMKYLQERFDINLEHMKVLDPCAGWGCRLLSFISLGCYYIGIDPNKRLHSHYREMIKDFGNSKKHKVYCKTFEEYYSKDMFDIVFTSPPFFDLEIYDDDDDQCYIKYRSKQNGYEIWLKEWMFPMVDKMIRFLKPGGLLCLNVSNSKNLSLFDDINKYLGHLSGVYHVKTIGLKNDAGTKIFPLLLYRKSYNIYEEIKSIKKNIIDIQKTLRNMTSLYNRHLTETKLRDTRKAVKLGTRPRDV